MVLRKQENERRFEPAGMTSLPKEIFSTSSTYIKQCYAEDLLRTRFRSERDQTTGSIAYTMNRKGDGVLSKPEEENYVEKSLFDEGWSKTRVRIEKIRYYYPCDGYVYEINLFQNELYGYIQVEVEFDTEEEAKKFIPPAWFGPEVTGNKAKENYGLAKAAETFFA